MRIGLTISGIASLTAFGGAVIFVLVSSAYRSVKHALYYSKVDAIVQWADTGCSVRGLSESMRSVLANNPRLANEQWRDCREVKGAIAFFKKEEVKVSSRPQAYVRLTRRWPGAFQPGRTQHGSIEDDAGQRGDLAHLCAQERSLDRRSRLLIVARGSRVAL
jgi:hypothetical protein